MPLTFLIHASILLSKVDSDTKVDPLASGDYQTETVSKLHTAWGGIKDKQLGLPYHQNTVDSDPSPLLQAAAVKKGRSYHRCPGANLKRRDLGKRAS